VRDRIVTFFYPAEGQQAQAYQIKQSLIAIGSGGITGRGFGQGIQKFTYLPEPMGDSIFAVAGEELGFAGAFFIVFLFTAFALRWYGIAARAPDLFGALLAVGISTYLASEAFVNIASMLGVAPLTGIPLTFISQGGSAMLASLGSAGILLSISRRRS
jgi:cell division protein FtsW